MDKMTTIAGVTMTKGSFDAGSDNDDFVLKPETTTYRQVEHLALAIACNQPVLLRGPTGCGKTAMVEYIARQTGRIPSRFFKVQLGQETDSRVLLGGYQVTDTPGQFIWKPGVLTKAVTEGHWILLEDINCASSDVSTLVSSLVKNGSMAVPGFSDNVQPHPDLQLFATERTFSTDLINTCSDLPNWLTLDLCAMSTTDLQTVIEARWPKLTPITCRLVSLLALEYWENSITKPSSRGLFQLCERANSYYVSGSSVLALRLFNDAVDVLCGSLPKHERFIAATQIGLALGIVENKAAFMGSAYKPTVTMMGNKLCVGRVILHQEPGKELEALKRRRTVFSLTRPACILMEQISCCVDNMESVLLVGETGCGKTSALQYLAEVLNKKLIVINMSQQSETVDLLGGFKPVSFKYVIQPLCHDFEVLFRATFDNGKNENFLVKLQKCMRDESWNMVLDYITHVHSRALANLKEKTNQDETPPKKKLKTTAKNLERAAKWEKLGKKIDDVSVKLKAAEKSPVFSFVEGTLVKAIKNGDWVLLDEINLASSETLDCLHGLLENRSGSLILLERGDLKPIARNQGFRLFAAMNPATDVGKSQLPVGLRNRFTEFFVDELDSEGDLLPIIQSYLQELNLSPEKIQNLAQFYLKIKQNSQTSILDGNGRPPHYSLRSLCRALMVAAENLCGSVPRSTFEGLCLAFLTQLDAKSYALTVEMVLSSVIGSGVSKSVLRQPIPKPSDSKKPVVSVEGYWLTVGTLKPSTPENYILTDTVKRHLKDLLRVVSLGGGIPVLLEGDTSVGKTSLVFYLAKCTGNVCARLNNHEHTDIQEYIGTYVADSKGKLVFKEGVLCEAMRKGYWLILDELNLAPTEVLEALNRVLDDNRELFVAETQTVIQAHPGFQLFATQNPTGIYGGRKELSRAFRNRFVELHVSQIPPDELTEILHRRCEMPMGYCKKMIAVMNDLQMRRRGSEIFVGKSGFITLRDLFRWGERYQLAEKQKRFYDWEQHLADEGYILLTGRVRVEVERKIIQEVLLKHFKKNVDPHNLFSLHENTSAVTRDILEKVLSFSLHDPAFRHIVWTYSLRRLAVLVCKAISFKEPVLLVGETGCGKTSVIQILAKLHKRDLFSVNCHMHSESADFLGGLRPVRNSSRDDGKLFEWVDGPLVNAVLSGSWFLADEISLADDSVLERLNSLLEPDRTLLLVEKGGPLSSDQEIKALPEFCFVGTMNPGGDFGKKELSPALRNRLTEIWAGVSDNILDDYRLIAVHNIENPPQPHNQNQIAVFMVAFIEWFKKAHQGRKVEISVRDLLTWIDFLNNTTMAGKMSLPEGLLHGCLLTFLDCLSADDGLKKNAMQYLKVNLEIFGGSCGNFEYKPFTKSPDAVGSHPFYIPVGPQGSSENSYLKYGAPTTLTNVAKVLRGMQTGKAILMEGSPGVGKTSLIEALAKDAGVTLTRINLSEQTDVSDLFGADLPEEGGNAGHFRWRDGAFLTALKESHWILLDELNLASQSVLEGLNAVLDHRGELFVPELNKSFHVPVGTKLFACQNPVSEGGNRRGLPRSFLNRFTRIYIEALTSNDYEVILADYIPMDELREAEWKKGVIQLMIQFSDQLNKLIDEGKLGIMGGPWELNLRDLIRWCQAITHDHDSLNCFRVMDTLYVRRFRTVEDRRIVRDTYRNIGLPGGEAESFLDSPTFLLTKSVVHIEEITIERISDEFHGSVLDLAGLGCSVNLSKGRRTLVRPLVHQLPILQILGRCVINNWLPILVGKNGTGKSSVVQTLATFTGHRLRVMAVSSAMDTTEILGGYEQAAVSRHIEDISSQAQVLVLGAACKLLLHERPNDANQLVSRWIQTISVTNLPDDGTNNMENFQLESLALLLNHETVRGGENARELCDELLEKIERLRKMSDGYLSNAGRFEWVDSPLVKCLRDGSWLLLEDVNLCSNAVLDRLNAVVEPGGVLSIGERGALADGSVFTITPHKNFRMFFSMNPRNGTISRAMRNRGVEIFLPDDGNVNGSDWDMAALVRDQETLLPPYKGLLPLHGFLSIHRELLTQGDFNLGHLISLAFWSIGGKLYKNPSFNSSVANAVDLVYKKNIEVNVENAETSFVNLTASRPSPEALIWRTDFARLCQSTAWIDALITRKDTDQFGVGLALGFHLLHAFLTTPGYVVEELTNNLKEKLKNVPQHLPFVLQSGEILTSRVKQFVMPWDMRWFRRGFKTNGNINCLLGYVKHIFDKTVMECSPTARGFMSLREYSQLVNKGQLVDKVKEEKFVARYVPFLDMLDKLVEEALLNRDAKWSEENLKWFLEAYTWITRLRRIGSAALIKCGKKEIVDYEIIGKLDLYVLWVGKKFLRPFAENFPMKKKRLKTLRECLKLLMPCEEFVDKTGLCKKSVMLRKLLNSPKPSVEIRLAVDSQPPGENLVVFYVFYLLASRLRSQFALESNRDIFGRILKSAYFPANHSLDFFIEENSLEQKLNLLRLVDIGYGELEGSQFLVMHRPVLVTECLNKLFPIVAVNLIALDRYQSDCAQIIARVLPHCTEISKIDEYDLSALRAETRPIAEFLSTQDWSICKTDLRLKIETVRNGLTNISSVGAGWLLLGTSQLMILSLVHHDPVQKKLTKLENSEREATASELEIKCHQQNSEIIPVNLNHVYLRFLADFVASSREAMRRQNDLVGLSRDFKMFTAFREECVSSVKQIVNRALDIVSRSNNADKSEGFFESVRIGYMTARAIIQKFQETFLNYFPDLVLPHLLALQQIAHGFGLIFYAPRDFDTQVHDALARLCKFPVAGVSPDLLNNDLRAVGTLSNFFPTFRVTLLVTAMQGLVVERILSDADGIKAMLLICARLVSEWRISEKKKEKEEAEKESLYLTKGTTKCLELTEEEELDVEQEKMFPSFNDKFESEIGLNDAPKKVKKTEESVSFISSSQMSTIRRMHSFLVNKSVCAAWILPEADDLKISVLEPLAERFRLLNSVAGPNIAAFSRSLDQELLPAMMVLLKEKQEFNSNNENYDMYTEPNLLESRRILPVLDALRLRLDDLLDQWPEHVTLLQIKSVMERVAALPVDSPLMCFLTGFEFILKACEHWEKNAHSGVSLSAVLVQITDLIIAWRKMEVQGWKKCLNNVRVRMRKEASKWWFHLWSLVEEFLNESNREMDVVLQALADFVELSPLGEFSERLSILKSFHAHILLLPKSFDEFAMRIWNLWRFYSQFQEPVDKRIAEITAPVVKKLEEFVKICKWHTISYFSLTQAIDKSHRTLLKFIKEYEKLLTQKVELLGLDPVCGEAPEGCPVFDIHSHFRIDGHDSKLVCLLAGEKFPKPGSLLEKTQKFCKDSVLEMPYFGLLDSLDGLVGQVITNLDHFGNVVPDSTLTSEKQKSQAKSLQQQKRRALADLFQVLNKLGLSYRAGSLGSTWNALQLSKGPPFSTALEKGKLSAEDYCMKAFARFLRLQQKLLTPSKEIGPPIIERIRGFSMQLMGIMQDLHQSLDIASTRKNTLVEITQIFEKFTSETFIPNQPNLEKIYRKFQEIVHSVFYTLKQFQYVLDSWPKKMEIDTFVVEDLNLLATSKDDESFRNFANQFLKVVAKVETIAASLENCFPSRQTFKIISVSNSIYITTDKIKLLTGKHEEILIESFKDFKELMSDIQNQCSSFGENNPIFTCLDFKSEKNDLEVLTNKLSDLQIASECDRDVRRLTENAVEHLLIGVQKVVKRLKAVQNNSCDDDNEDSGDLFNNHLTVELVGSLNASLDDLCLENVEAIFLDVVEEVRKMGRTDSGEIRGCLASVVPFLKQYTALSGYFIDQLRATYRATSKFTSVLMGVFLLVTEKGYCAPPELDGEGLEGEAGNGFGLGEGEGKTDVSDRIESEDQLEDARPEGEQREEKEEECAEEDKGIETSEDFGGKPQDVKENEDNESGEEMDDEEPDKEMGETETGAEQLDKEMWDSEDEGNQDLPEDQGGGQTFGDEEFGANEDEDGEGNDKKQDKKDITDVNEGEEDTEQIDPYHGEFQPPPEPEAMDLPDDLQLDDEEGKGEEDNEENPFDIDEMKEPKLPEETPAEESDNLSNDEETKADESEQQGEDDADNEEEDKEGEENIAGEGPEGEPEMDNPNRDDQFQPSDDKPTESAVQAAPDTKNAEKQSRDKVAGNNGQYDDLKPQENSEEQENQDAGTGQADMDQSSTGNEAKASKQSASQQSQETRKRSSRPGKSNEDRSLGDQKHKNAKRMRAVEKDDRDGQTDDPQAPNQVDLVQHARDGKMEALDTATEDQSKTLAKPEDDGLEPTNDMEIEEIEESLHVDDAKEVKPNTNELQTKPDDDVGGDGDGQGNDPKMMTEGDFIETQNVSRGAESSLRSQLSLLSCSEKPLGAEEVQALRKEILNQLATMPKGSASPESRAAWQMITSTVDGLSRELTEQLRLILEPSLASRLKGDYRTGRRINMRKVISYIASDFRKDRIWLRRTKPWKREHQIVLAIDDSSSMADNQSKELAFESVALVSKAISFLEAGDLSIMSFGESAKVLHSLGDPFTDDNGAQILAELTFEQKRTKMREAIDLAIAMFTGTRRRNAAQLLLMVSDGRGVFSEGLDPVRLAVRRALTAGIFIVFLVIDDPKASHSIMDIRQPEFKDGQYTGAMKSYMESFPFPFYLILRDIGALPGTLSDALRQWFQITAPPT